jgi:hypothetical protein
MLRQANDGAEVKVVVVVGAFVAVVVAVVAVVVVGAVVVDVTVVVVDGIVVMAGHKLAHCTRVSGASPGSVLPGTH